MKSLLWKMLRPVLATNEAYIPASTHNEAMLSGAWTSIAQ